MELSVPRQNTLKISTKKGYILVDPDAMEDAKIIILNDSSATNIKQGTENLLIYGPGDYELNGILVKGVRSEGGVVYTIDSGDGKILVAQSSSVEKLGDEDDYDAVVVKVIDKIDEANISAVSSNLVIVYGDETVISDQVKVNKVNKLNLKKHDELTSNVVYLEKK